MDANGVGSHFLCIEERDHLRQTQKGKVQAFAALMTPSSKRQGGFEEQQFHQNSAQTQEIQDEAFPPRLSRADADGTIKNHKELKISEGDNYTWEKLLDMFLGTKNGMEVYGGH